MVKWFQNHASSMQWGKLTTAIMSKEGLFVIANEKLVKRVIKFLDLKIF